MLHEVVTQARRADEPLLVAGEATSLSLAIERDLSFDGADYVALCAASSATAFQHPIWLSALMRRLAPARRAEPFIVTGRCGASGALRLVLPLLKRTKSGVRLLEAADLGVSDYAAPVVDARWWAVQTPAARERLARQVASVLPAYDLLRIKPMRDEHCALWTAILPLSSERLGFSAHAVALPPSHDQWRRTALSDGFRKSLERKVKRARKLPGARLERLVDPGRIAAAIAWLAHMRAGRFHGDPIQSEPVRDFYTDVAVAGAASGFAQVHALEIDGEWAGVTLGITAAGRFHYLLIGCDYERHGRLSPGLVLYDGLIAEWIAQGGTVFDFTIGDEPFKADFGTEPTALYGLAATPTWRGRLGRWALEARGRLAARAAARPAPATTQADNGGDHG